MNQFNNKVLDRIPMVSLTYGKLKTAHFFKDIKKEVERKLKERQKIKSK